MFTTSLLRRAGAECIGTYALVTAGCGAIVVNSMTGDLTHIGVAFTFGLIITVIIAAAGHLSGAHFNPAVTVAFTLTRHFPWRDVPIYIGANLGAFAYQWLRTPLPQEAGTAVQANREATANVQPQIGG